jgi:hypothetical protein
MLKHEVVRVCRPWRELNVVHLLALLRVSESYPVVVHQGLWEVVQLRY